jgi:hypothetical protein
MRPIDSIHEAMSHIIRAHEAMTEDRKESSIIHAQTAYTMLEDFITMMKKDCECSPQSGDILL